MSTCLELQRLKGMVVKKRWAMNTACPDLRLLFIDLDQNTCDANRHNRLHFLLEGVRRRV